MSALLGPPTAYPNYKQQLRPKEKFMAKGQDSKKSVKKQAGKTLKEKRIQKKERRTPASNPEA